MASLRSQLSSCRNRERKTERKYWVTQNSCRYLVRASLLFLSWFSCLAIRCECVYTDCFVSCARIFLFFFVFVFLFPFFRYIFSFSFSFSNEWLYFYITTTTTITMAFVFFLSKSYRQRLRCCSSSRCCCGVRRCRNARKCCMLKWRWCVLFRWGICWFLEIEKIKFPKKDRRYTFHVHWPQKRYQLDLRWSIRQIRVWSIINMASVGAWVPVIL
jgi:hypothetical protein